MIISPLGTYLNPSATGLPPFFNIQPVSQSVSPASATFGVQPANQYETVGDTATFFVEAGSPDGGTLSYQWQYAVSPYTVWNDITLGGTSNTYTTPTLVIGDDLKQYRCKVTNTKSGLTVTFTSEATDPESPSGITGYQWYTSAGSSSALPNNQNATISSTSTGMTGPNPATGSFYCRATDTSGLSTNSNTVSATIFTTSVTNSNAATLNVDAASAEPSVWEDPVSTSGTLVYLGASASDTSMQPYGVDYNTNTSGYGEFTWANIPVDTATIYFDYAFNVGSNQYGTVPPTTQTAIIQISFNGEPYFTPYDYVNNRLLRGRSNETSIASTPFSIQCPNTVTNLNQVRVRVFFSCGILQQDITEWDAFAQAVTGDISASYT